MNSNLIIGLDIGSSDIKAIIGARKEGQPEVEFLTKKRIPSEGVRRGAVIEPDKVSQKINSLLSKLSQEIGQNVDRAFINIGGSHISTEQSRGTVAVSRADHKISQQDIGRVIKAAKTFSLPSNQEILDVFPNEFIVDKKQGIKKPLGMKGVRLEAKILAICVFSPYLENLTKAVLDSGLEIEDIVPSGLASSKAVLEDRQQELGVAAVDVGAWTTDLAVFEEKSLIHSAVFPIGSAHITNDIAIGLQTDIDIAEGIKKKFGDCFSRKKGRKKIEVPEDPSLSFSQNSLIKIIKPRVSEIFEEVQNELKTISKNKLLPAGVVLTGGGSTLPGMVKLAKKKLGLPCRVSSPQLELENPSWSTSWGLVLTGSELKQREPSTKEKILSKLKKAFKIFVP